MNVLAERTSPPLRARLVECDCPYSDCRTVFVVMSLTDSRPLWLTMGASLSGEDKAAESVDDMLDDPMREVGDVTLRHLIEAGQAILGLSWEEIDVPHSHERLEAQFRAWSVLPEWMERLPAGRLWATRGCVFGRPLTRVPRALYAHAQSYVPDQPERYEDFDQDGRWGLDLRGPLRMLAFFVPQDVPVPAEVLLDHARWDA